MVLVVVVVVGGGDAFGFTSRMRWSLPQPIPVGGAGQASMAWLRKWENRCLLGEDVEEEMLTK